MLEELEVGELPGVGRSMVARLQAMGAATVGQLAGLSLARLQEVLGAKTGQNLYSMARGRDDRGIELEQVILTFLIVLIILIFQVRKTVSAEVNYGIRFSSWPEAETFLGQLAAEVSSRLRALARKGRGVTLKLMVRAAGAPQQTSKFLGHGVCDSLSKSTVLRTATSCPEVILREMSSLARCGEETSPNKKCILWKCQFVIVGPCVASRATGGGWASLCPGWRRRAGRGRRIYPSSSSRGRRVLVTWWWRRGRRWRLARVLS